MLIVTIKQITLFGIHIIYEHLKSIEYRITCKVNQDINHAVLMVITSINFILYIEQFKACYKYLFISMEVYIATFTIGYKYTAGCLAPFY